MCNGSSLISSIFKHLDLEKLDVEEQGSFGRQFIALILDSGLSCLIPPKFGHCSEASARLTVKKQKRCWGVGSYLYEYILRLFVGDIVKVF